MKTLANAAHVAGIVSLVVAICAMPTPPSRPHHDRGVARCVATPVAEHESEVVLPDPVERGEASTTEPPSGVDLPRCSRAETEVFLLPGRTTLDEKLPKRADLERPGFPGHDWAAYKPSLPETADHPALSFEDARMASIEEDR